MRTCEPGLGPVLLLAGKAPTGRRCCLEAFQKDFQDKTRCPHLCPQYSTQRWTWLGMRISQPVMEVVRGTGRGQQSEDGVLLFGTITSESSRLPTPALQAPPVGPARCHGLGSPGPGGGAQQPPLPVPGNLGVPSSRAENQAPEPGRGAVCLRADLAPAAETCPDTSGERGRNKPGLAVRGTGCREVNTHAHAQNRVAHTCTGVNAHFTTAVLGSPCPVSCRDPPGSAGAHVRTPTEGQAWRHTHGARRPGLMQTRANLGTAPQGPHSDLLPHLPGQLSQGPPSSFVHHEGGKEALAPLHTRRPEAGPALGSSTPGGPL